MNDNKIKGELLSHTEPFLEQDWAEMEKLLDKKEKRKAFFWLPYAASIILLGGAFFLFPFSQVQETTQATDTSMSNNELLRNNEDHKNPIPTIDEHEIINKTASVSTEVNSIGNRVRSTPKKSMTKTRRSSDFTTNLNIEKVSDTSVNTSNAQVSKKGENTVIASSTINSDTKSYESKPSIPQLNTRDLGYLITRLESKETPLESSTSIKLLKQKQNIMAFEYWIEIGAISKILFIDLKTRLNYNGYFAGLHVQHNRWKASFMPSIISFESSISPFNTSIENDADALNSNEFSYRTGVIVSSFDQFAEITPIDQTIYNYSEFSIPLDIQYEFIQRRINLSAGIRTSYTIGTWNNYWTTGPVISTGYKLKEFLSINYTATYQKDALYNQIGISARF